jgi:hypothetical protein
MVGIGTNDFDRGNSRKDNVVGDKRCRVFQKLQASKRSEMKCGSG